MATCCWRWQIPKMTRERAVELQKIGHQFHPEMRELARMAILYLDERELAESARKDALSALGEAGTLRNQLEQLRVYCRSLERDVVGLTKQLASASAGGGRTSRKAGGV